MSSLAASRRAAPLSRAGGACPTVSARRTGHSRSWCEASPRFTRTIRRNRPGRSFQLQSQSCCPRERSKRRHAISPSSPVSASTNRRATAITFSSQHADCSRVLHRTSRCSSSSRTCTGRTPAFWISSSIWRLTSGMCRWSSWASPGRSSSTADQVGVAVCSLTPRSDWSHCQASTHSSWRNDSLRSRLA